MANRTIFRDNPKTRYREAWQNKEKVYEWSEYEVETMSKEAPNVVPEWGRYKADTPVMPGKRRKSSNVELRGAHK